LYPAVAYPTYEMGATLAGCRAVAVPLDDEWHLDLDSISDADAARAVVLWVNEPGNPTGSAADRARLRETVRWARDRGIVVANDECYIEFAYTAEGERPEAASVLHAGSEGVLAVHSLSKRSNIAGLRIGFLAGDPDLVGYLGEVRKHAGCMVPGPVQAAGAAALGDDAHVDEQRARYWDRRVVCETALRKVGIESLGGPATFYLWCRSSEPAVDGWTLAARLAATGTLVSPGSLYGDAGNPYVRIALVQPVDRLELAADRIVSALAS
jgi:aspartate/methionine/tyrosine aminotransferase